jgi:hypothetical protein
VSLCDAAGALALGGEEVDVAFASNATIEPEVAAAAASGAAFLARGGLGAATCIPKAVNSACSNAAMGSEQLRITCTEGQCEQFNA